MEYAKAQIIEEWINYQTVPNSHSWANLEMFMNWVTLQLDSKKQIDPQYLLTGLKNSKESFGKELSEAKDTIRSLEVKLVDFKNKMREMQCEIDDLNDELFG